MKHTPKRSRLFFYTAGSISLLLLPILCINKIKERVVRKHKYVKEVIICDLKDTSGFDQRISATMLNRKFLEISLAGNNEDDRVRLDFAQLAIRELIEEKDTSTGVHIKFMNTTKYWAWVRALDICEIEKAQTYICYKNDLWIYNLSPAFKPKKPASFFICGTSCNSIPYGNTEKNNDDGYAIYLTAKKYWAVEVLFAALVLLAIKAGVQAFFRGDKLQAR